MSKPVYALSVTALGLLACLSVGLAMADNRNFTVQPQKEQVISLGLSETDSVTGSFSVVSDDESGISFHVIDPDGKAILEFENVSQKSFTLIANSTGDYQLHFDNSLSPVYSKTVALNYNVTHYTFGIPQEQFLLIVIAVVALIGIFAYAVLMPK